MGIALRRIIRYHLFKPMEVPMKAWTVWFKALPTWQKAAVVLGVGVVAALVGNIISAIFGG
jgi:hypothetical protein